MMGGWGRGPGWMMRGYGYGPGWMMRGGGGYGMGPGMMYGYGQNGQRYDGRHHTYRGRRSCWHRPGRSRNSGYYGACS